MRGAFHILLSLVVLFSIPPLAPAHEVDGLQYPYSHLGLDDPEFFQCHFEYWHCRRELNAQIREYTRDVGAVEALHDVLDWPRAWEFTPFVEYWDVVPAHPIVDLATHPNRLAICQDHIVACEAGFLRDYVNWFHNYRLDTTAYVRSLIRKR